MCLQHYNVIQWDSEKSHLPYKVHLPSLQNINVQKQMWLEIEQTNSDQKDRVNFK